MISDSDMKRMIFVFLLPIFVVCSLQIVSAISTTLNDSYSKGETIITEVSGNILEPIGAVNVEFRRGHVIVPFDYDLKKLGETYYLWAITPQTEMNYTLIIKNITTFVSGKVQKINYERNFSVSGNLSDYSIKPGFILTDKNFEVKVQLNEDNNKQIDVIFTGSTTFTLKPGENTIKFSITGIEESGPYNISIGRYTLPAYIKTNKTTTSTGEQNIPTANLTNLTVIEKNATGEEKEAIEEERAKHYCYEFPGSVCSADEVCSGQSITSADGPCCVNGECQAKGSGGSSWIGYLLAAVVIIAAVFVWMRYKKVRAEKNPLEKKIHSIEKKMP